MWLSLILSSSIAALADGDFYASGPWGTKITGPCVISAPGSYYLANNISSNDYYNIIVESDDVTLDLMGYSINGRGLGGTPNGVGILIKGRKNVEIRNGSVNGWYYGISESMSSGIGHRIINVRAENNLYGVHLEGTAHLIRGCQVAASNGYVTGGIYVMGPSMISDCLIKNFTSAGIALSACVGMVTNNVVIGTDVEFSIGMFRTYP